MSWGVLRPLPVAVWPHGVVGTSQEPVPLHVDAAAREANAFLA